MNVVFFVSIFIIFWAMIGYPLFLLSLSKIYKGKEKKFRKFENLPTVTLLIVAHNEEKVILNKLENCLELDYDFDKMEILIASDNSSDDTNDIVEKFINTNKKFNVKLFKVQNRKGKTNAQNEAVNNITSEFIVMTDANSIFKKDAISQLICSFASDDIAYVCGRLVYINDDNITCEMESSYWNIDLKMRLIESNIQTITAGNGAIYACRKSDYVHFDPISSHDSSMPLNFAINGKRALFNENAIAFEKTGATINDEYKRKVRMNRNILKNIFPTIKLLNLFKMKWFSIFYFGHRTCRYLLWFCHLMIFFISIFLFNTNIIYLLSTLGHLSIFLLIFFIKAFNIRCKICLLIYYYCVTIFAQFHGIMNILFGKTKPFWDKADTTR